ncbi:DUF664 domain-containing protein [Streptomyces durhamensis]|nr:DUF664 domain-containing protein [Streptomyces durhamensis]
MSYVVRDVLMIQECARHNGHADFLRERTDGAHDPRNYLAFP